MPTFEDVEKHARALTPSQKASLARMLIEELDEAADPDAARLWLEECQRRYDAHLAGALDSLPGDEVMGRARNRLK
ncbi:MAG: addiction module protein [Acidobacteria bacterium]|nr:addiction module protein [Acidobacteriota bacterium]